MNRVRVNRSTVAAGAVMAMIALAVLVAPGAEARPRAANPVSVTGTFVCEPTTGKQVVTWTFQNFLANPVSIDSAVDDLSASATFSSNPVASQGSATAVSEVPGDYVGDFNLHIDYTEQNVVEGDSSTKGEVVLPGGCTITETTTTTTTTTAPADTTTSQVGATTTTTAPVAAAAAEAVASSPSYTG